MEEKSMYWEIEWMTREEGLEEKHVKRLYREADYKYSDAQTYATAILELVPHVYKVVITLFEEDNTVLCKDVFYEEY